MSVIDEMQQLVKTFCEQRDWDQFHNPKDLAIGISTEANELLDIFRFKSETQIKEEFEIYRPNIEDELADVLFFILRFAQMNNINLEQALVNKIEKNEKKYSVEKSKGSNKKYTEL